MKRFRFPADSLLGIRRNALQGLEGALAAAEAQLAEALRRAQDLERQSCAARESIERGKSLRGADLRLAAAASEAMLLQARASYAAAAALERDAAEARRKVLRARREVETLERLREKSLSEWRHAVQLEEEALAGELFLVRLPRGDNQ
jgi:hypothetical protein